MTRVLIAGGGVAALEAMLALRALAEERVAVELLAPEPHFWYRPLAVAEPFGLGNAHQLELSRLTAAAGALFSPGALASVDSGRQIARTAQGVEIGYDLLLLAVGAVPREAVPGALTFRGPADREAFVRLLRELESGSVRRLVFAVPGGISWPLPLYELALLTSAWLAAHDIAAELALVTPERAPLAAFGPRASEALRELLADRGIALHTESYPAAFESGALQLVPEGELAADRAVALPTLSGPTIDGIPRDDSGFVPTDENGRVQGVDDVYAAGDATSFPLKQGGIAAQQAVAAAQTIAARAGAPVTPEPFRPVLRGLLLTGAVPQFMRTELSRQGDGAFQLDTDPLWWPPGKIAGRYLGPFLAEQGGFTALSGPPPEGIPVEVDLSARIQTVS